MMFRIHGHSIVEQFACLYSSYRRFRQVDGDDDSATNIKMDVAPDLFAHLPILLRLL